MSGRLGQQLGNYRLIRLLGRGNFGEVYLGEHVHLKTHAAIKVLLAHIELQRFLGEARIIAGLKHSHIARVLGFGIEATTPFLVMEYAPAGTLRQRYPKGTLLPVTTVIAHVKQIAAALQYVHDHKLIHRDVKPENILLEQNDNLLLSDFGIAIEAHTTSSLGTQDVSGTPLYMAPEQIQGKPRPASDLYALGIMVYEWLVGTPPFTGSYWEVYTQHVSVPPPPLREKVPAISSSIEEVVLKALAKDYHQRFASVLAFATALGQAQVSEEPTRVESAADSSLLTLPAPRPPVTKFLPRLETTLYTYWGHSQPVKSVAWSPDGKRLASASRDGTVQIWDAFTGNNVLFILVIEVEYGQWPGHRMVSTLLLQGMIRQCGFGTPLQVRISLFIVIIQAGGLRRVQ